MANVQIYQLDGVSSNLDNSALLACDITNPDASERATTPKVTRKLSVAELESQVLNDEEYTTELNTANQTIFGAINEHHSVIGYSYDAYDDTATYSVGDLCIYNNALYKCTTAITTPEAWNASHWTETSIADEISAKVSKSGDDISGTLTYKTDINPSTAPSANKGFNIVALDDVNDEQLLRLETYQNTANTIRGQMVVSRKVGNNTVLNYLNMGIKADGTKDVGVSDPALWQEAIGIKVLSATDNITVSGGKNRFSHIFNAPTGYSYIGYSVSWSDSAIASTDYDFSSMVFGTNQIFVNITAPSGTSRASTLNYKMIYLKN